MLTHTMQPPSLEYMFTTKMKINDVMNVMLKNECYAKTCKFNPCLQSHT